ncbi:hypothetical protein EYR41_002178 [Orbilia oligospora]|uniref:Uncharacterized protein n=1 Tax=Orbilia oligospora TaxID=2813651 RepID=A0A7C8PN23_ORBOL|nr:hypothetical protein TWF751_004638 [Orbilia oligospora]TGJ75240.1 hypothetical protein EYR41_002178 [Orbilia oligospora]
MPRCRSTGLATIAVYSLLLLLLPPLPTTAQTQSGDPNAAACSYLDDALDVCWRRRQLLYNDPTVANCICNVGGLPDPLIDPAVPLCSSYLRALGRENRATAFYSSFNGYCASYAPGGEMTTTEVMDIVTTPPPVPQDGRASCTLVLQTYSLCQKAPQDLIIEPGVASCICHDPTGAFTTGFDELLTPCHSWATTGEPDFASEVSSLFGFCTKFGTFTVETITSMTSQFTLGPTAPRTIPSLSFSQIEDAASSACEQMARIANACRTGPVDPLTRPGVANCICVDRNDPNHGFGVEFDTLLSHCYPYARTKSPAAAREIENLSGYCTRFAEGGKTYTVTSTEINTTRTVTDDVFVSSTGPPAETNPAEAIAGRTKVGLAIPLVFSLAAVIVGQFL